MSIVNVVLTGAVGVGKTTLCEAIKQYYIDSTVNVTFIPEYLAHPQGLSLLNEYLTKKITNVTFQNFIMDYYDQTLSKLVNVPDTINIRIFERTPDDSLLLFANLANLNDEFDDLALLNLYDRVNDINEKYSIPSIISHNTKISKIITDSLTKNVSEIINIIDADVKESNNRIIFLFNDVDTVEKRIRSRNREGESTYTKDTIKMFCDYYKNIYEYISLNNHIRFVDLGRFLDKTTKNNKKQSDNYKIAFIGPVSVGKSTISTIIRDKYDALKITESNETSLGSAMLTAYLDGYVSDVTFQEYIHDYYRHYHQTKISSNNFIVYDGLPDIGVTCFSNIANLNGKLNNSDYLRLNDKIKKLDKDFDIPSIFLQNSEYSYITTDNIVQNIEQIIKIIDDDRKNKISHRIIFLSNSVNTLSKRINLRGRNGEEKYTNSDDKIITQFHFHFEKLQEWCKNNYKTRFVDMGAFIN